MRFWLLLGALMTVVGGSGPVTAQTRQQIDQCSGQDGSSPDTVIAACTTLLEVKSLPAKLRAVVLTNRAVGHVRKGSHDLAVKGLDRSIDLDSGQAFPYIVRGSSYDDLGQRERALQDFDKAIALDPRSSAAFFNRGIVHMRKGDDELALKDYDRTIELDPTDTSALRIRGWVRLKLMRFDAAVADFDKALSLEPSSAMTLLGRGRAKRMMGDVERGDADINAAKRIEPDIEAQAAKLGLSLDSRGP